MFQEGWRESIPASTRAALRDRRCTGDRSGTMRRCASGEQLQVPGGGWNGLLRATRPDPIRRDLASGQFVGEDDPASQHEYGRAEKDQGTRCFFVENERR